MVMMIVMMMMMVMMGRPLYRSAMKEYFCSVVHQDKSKVTKELSKLSDLVQCISDVSE